MIRRQIQSKSSSKQDLKAAAQSPLPSSLIYSLYWKRRKKKKEIKAIASLLDIRVKEGGT